MRSHSLTSVTISNLKTERKGMRWHPLIHHQNRTITTKKTRERSGLRYFTVLSYHYCPTTLRCPVTEIATRRFAARPAFVLLLAIG